jgi:hypothetical protein
MFAVVSLLSVLAVLAAMPCGTTAWYYCDAPFSAPFPVNATGKSLRHVSIIHRHGARVPYAGWSKATLAAGRPGPPVNWTCNLVSQASATAGDVFAPRSLVKLYAAQENVLRGNCMLGQLTVLGQQQHHRVGQAYRAKYVSLLNFLPARFDQNSSALFWFRSTDYQRTLASLESNFNGFFPPGKQQQRLMINTRDQPTDYLLGGEQCPAYPALLKALQATPAYQAVAADLAALQKQARAAVGTDELNLLRDHSWCRKCTGLADFKGLDDALFEQIDGNVTAETFLRQSTPALQQLSVGPFFNNVIRMMRGIAKNDTFPRWAHYSAHDSTLVAVFAALDNALTQWPAYASHVELELWQDDATPTQFYVQVVVNGKVQTNLWNSNAAMMTLDFFEQSLKPILITEEQWRTQCRPGLDKK